MGIPWTACVIYHWKTSESLWINRPTFWITRSISPFSFIIGDVDNITIVPCDGLDAYYRRHLPPRCTTWPHWQRQSRWCADRFWCIVFPFIASPHRPNLFHLSRYLWRWRHRVLTVRKEQWYKVVLCRPREYSFKDCSLIRTDADFEEYIRKVWAPDASDEELEPLWTYYTSVPSKGSPFGRLNLDSPYPQFNRLSAFQGDIAFQGPRRAFTKALSSRGQKTWVYCALVKTIVFFFPRVYSSITMTILVSKRFKYTPVIGSVSDTISYTGLYPGINNGLASTMGPTPSRRLILSFPMLLTSSITSTRTLEVGFIGRNTLLKDQNPSRSKFSPSLTTC